MQVGALHVSAELYMSEQLHEIDHGTVPEPCSTCYRTVKHMLGDVDVVVPPH